MVGRTAIGTPLCTCGHEREKGVSMIPGAPTPRELYSADVDDGTGDTNAIRTARYSSGSGKTFVEIFTDAPLVIDRNDWPRFRREVTDALDRAATAAGWGTREDQP